MSARESAWNLLRQWTALTAPPQVPERADAHPQWKSLDPRDRAFAFDLVTGVIRWRNLLDAVIASRLRQPIDRLDISVRALLWLGAYQLLIQGGTADYAAVDTSVTLARKYQSTAPAAGLVNAVLRGITRLQPTRRQVSTPTLSRRTFPLDFSNEIVFTEDIFPDPASALTAHLAATRSHPPALVDHLQQIYPTQAADILLRNNQRPVITLRADGPVTIPAESGLAPYPDAADFFIASTGWNESIEYLVKSGQLSPQDPTAAKPIRRLAELTAAGTLPTPACILDLCAGLGTKTIQLARAFPAAQITAADIDPDKLHRLARRAADLKITNVTTLLLSPQSPPPPRNFHDCILVDVPCSNTGVMARRIQSRWRWPALDHAALHQLQTQLLTQGCDLAAPGATIIYSTCSIDPAENTAIVPPFPDLQPIEHHLTLPSLHNLHPHDGGYFTILRR